MTLERNTPSAGQGEGGEKDGLDAAQSAATGSPEARWRETLLPLLEGLPLLPIGAGGRGKAPIDPDTGKPLKDWPVARYTPVQIAGMNGKVIAVGIPCGPDAGGLLVIDLDGRSAIELAWRYSCYTDTPTWRILRTTCTDRLKLVFRVPPEQWEALNAALAGKGVVKLTTRAVTPEEKAEGRKSEQIEVLWHNHQGLVAGLHKESGGFYHWGGTKPADIAVLEGPWKALVGKVIQERDGAPASAPAGPAPAPAPAREPCSGAVGPQESRRLDSGRKEGRRPDWAPEGEAKGSADSGSRAQEPAQEAAAVVDAPPPPTPPRAPSTGLVVPLEEFITREHRELIQQGSSKGSNNGDGLELSLDLVGAERWVRDQGAIPDLGARQLFGTYMARSEVNYGPGFDRRAALARFEGAEKQNPMPSTPEEKLRERLEFHRRQAGKGERSGGERPPLDPVKQVEALRVRIREINSLPDPAARTLCLQRLLKELGVTEKGFAQLVRDLIESETDSGPTTFEELMAVEPSKPLAEDLFPLGGLVLLAGDGSAGKSSIGYRLSEAVAMGGKFAGQHQCLQSAVVIVQKDEPPTDARAKWARMGFMPPPGLIHLLWKFTPSMLPELEQQIRDTGARLVVMDSLLSIAGGHGTKATDAEFALFVYQLNHLAGRLGVTILLIHHLNRSKGRTEVTKDDVYGSTYIVNAASSVWGLWWATEEAAQSGEARLKCLKDRSGIVETGTTYDLLGSQEDYSWTHMGIHGRTTSLDQIHGAKGKAIHMLKASGEKLTKEEIAQGVGCSVDTAKKLLTELYDARCGVSREPIPTSTRGGRPSYRYWWSAA